MASFSKTKSKLEEGIDVEDVLNELEHKVERLKIIYEQYFMGIEKLEPQTARKEITRKLIELTQLQIRNTALRYRFHSLNQKFGAYVTYWNRTLREIENGTYYRSIARAGRDAARKGVEVPDEVLRALPKRLRDRIARDRDRIAAADTKTADAKTADTKTAAATSAGPVLPEVSARPAVDLPPATALTEEEKSFDASFEELFESLTTRKPAASAPVVPVMSPPKPRAVPALPPGMDEEKVRDLHRRYVAARQAVGESGQIRYEQIFATVVKQGARILAEHAARVVDFGVVVKDGKVILQATPKK